MWLLMKLREPSLADDTEDEPIAVSESQDTLMAAAQALAPHRPLLWRQASNGNLTAQLEAAGPDGFWITSVAVL